MSWEQDLTRLVEQVTKWISQSHGSPGTLVLHEQNMEPTPDEPLLEIEVNRENVLRLEPAGFAAHKKPTVVHLYAYPSMRRVRLVGPDDDGHWRIESREGVDMNYSWTADDFLKVVSILGSKSIPKTF